MFSIQRYVIKVCQLLAAGQWFSLRTLVSSTNKIDRHDITEILLKLSLNIVRFELTTLLVIDTDCIGSCLQYDDDHDGPLETNKLQRILKRI